MPVDRIIKVFIFNKYREFKKIFAIESIIRFVRIFKEDRFLFNIDLIN